jgi:hypothetical protein
LVNGQVLRPGQWINGFRILSIGSGSVTVVKDNVEVDLHMK